LNEIWRLDGEEDDLKRRISVVSATVVLVVALPNTCSAFFAALDGQPEKRHREKDAILDVRDAC
jgi:hypothetical protein